MSTALKMEVDPQEIIEAVKKMKKQDREEFLEDLKCIKLVYMNNNWYLATENEEKQFRFLRLSFIKKVGYSKNNKVTFQASRVEHYHDFFSSVQNAMTLQNTQFKKATLKASPGMALYFKENMKPFFPSQEYVKTEENRKELCDKTQISYEDIMDLTRLTDLSRIKWVGPIFARLLILSGYNTVEKVTKANY